jgi:hypothetical protein
MLSHFLGNETGDGCVLFNRLNKKTITAGMHAKLPHWQQLPKMATVVHPTDK